MGQTNYNGALQKPIGSGFSAASASAEVINDIDLTGKIAIVTGGNTGIGLETTRTLANAGATVIVPARDLEKARKNLQGINNVEIAEMDLMDPASIETFTRRFLASERSLHILINNAGIMWVPLRRDIRGIESQLATNYLAPFQLTAGLWTALRKTEGARVINVSSQGHQFAPFHFDDPNFEHRDYETMQAYGQSKTAVNLFSLELDYRARRIGVRAYSLHPGNIAGTELAREASVELFQKMGLVDDNGNLLPEVTASLKTIPQGAATTIWCAVSPLLNNIGGVYCENTDIAGLASEEGVSDGVKRYSPDIKLCYEAKLSKIEVVFDSHMLVWFISGETKIIQADHSYLFKAGDIFLIPRNLLATIIHFPEGGLPNKSVVMHLTAERLREFYGRLNINPKAAPALKIHRFSRHLLLESCLSSLIPYFDVQQPFPENIASLKITEAITILRTIDKDIDSILANFEEPGKIDLSEFMEKNFMFNMPLEKFGYLTGRSLTTFKRDFHKIYNTTPQRWLTQKRLGLAHFQLTQKNRKPVDVYLETGFENLSHFSHAFKKQFGLTPTELVSQKSGSRE